MMKDTICVAVGLVGGFFTAIFGGWDSALVTLVVFMAIDFSTQPASVLTLFENFRST